MASDSGKPLELARQLAKTWESTQGQLRELRKSVEYAAELARAQSTATTYTRERDKALRDLGEALWKELKDGRLEAPASAGALVQAVEEADRRFVAAAASITELLRETEHQPSSPPSRKGSNLPPPTGVLQKPKKK